MRSVQEIFIGDLAGARTGIVQKLRPDDHNLGAFHSSYSESWPSLQKQAELLILSLAEEGASVRKIYAGFIVDVLPSPIYPTRFRFYVDRFRYVGEHDLRLVSDGTFYGNGGGGGSRVYVDNQTRGGNHRGPSGEVDLGAAVPEGAMERRLVWVRKNHHRFRDPVWQYWESKCAVTDSECNGLLVASHIFPWAKSNPTEKTDRNNGLLLSAPIDALFDRGWISFADTGEMLMKKELSQDTRLAFGLTKKAYFIAKREKISPRMKKYLKRHRQFHGFVG